MQNESFEPEQLEQEGDVSELYAYCVPKEFGYHAWFLAHLTYYNELAGQRDAFRWNGKLIATSDTNEFANAMGGPVTDGIFPVGWRFFTAANEEDAIAIFNDVRKAAGDTYASIAAWEARQ